MTETVRVVLVGLGGYGQSYVQAVLADGDAHGVALVGGVDPRPEGCERLADLVAAGVPIVSSLAEFYREAQADLAVISAPIQFHEPLSRLAIENGSHVLCEKPLAATVAEARRMADFARRAGRFLAIGYQWSFADATQTLKRDIMAGTFGAPIRLKTMTQWPRNAGYYARSPWAGRQRMDDGAWVLDSPVNNATAHYLHHLLYLTGATQTTSARPVHLQAELYRANPIGNFDTGFLRGRLDNGAEMLYMASHAVPSHIGPVCQYDFEHAVIHNCFPGWDAFVARFKDGRLVRYGDADRTGCNKLWDCVDAVRTGVPVACDVETATAQTLCVNAAALSCPEVTPFDQSLIRTVGNGPDQVTYVQDLQPVFSLCWGMDALPAELGCTPWAVAGKAVDIDADFTFPPVQG